jgi:hypothetical protein
LTEGGTIRLSDPPFLGKNVAVWEEYTHSSFIKTNVNEKYGLLSKSLPRLLQSQSNYGIIINEVQMQSIYIETTIPSYATAKPSNDLIKAGRQSLTNLFWETKRQEYQLFISQYVIDECKNGDEKAAAKRLDFIKDIHLLAKSPEIDALAELYKHLLSIPPKADIDAYHMATAVIHQVDYLLSWNFTHMGPRSYKLLLEYNSSRNFNTPIFITPDFFYEEENDEHMA